MWNKFKSALCMCFMLAITYKAVDIATIKVQELAKNSPHGREPW